MKKVDKFVKDTLWLSVVILIAGVILTILHPNWKEIIWGLITVSPIPPVP